MPHVAHSTHPRPAHLVLGLEPRALLALVEACGIRHVRVGRRILARVDDVLDAIDALAIEQGHSAATTRALKDGPELGG